jgi:hypothetical protein
MNMMQPQYQQQSSSAALEQWSDYRGGGDSSGGGGVSACRQGSLYEENDLLDLIAQL